MSKIKEISNDMNSLLKSQVSLNSLADVIREIVQNGIDAHAQNIFIKLSVNLEDESINIDYIDDGIGIHPESLSNFGKQFYTSKVEADIGDDHQGLNVLKNVDTFGFRGEAMHSLRNLCDTVIVISRVKDYNNGFKACFNGDTQIGSIIKSDKVVKVGTSVKLIGLFEKVSVRKKILIDNLRRSWIKDTFEIRKALLHGLVKNPFINIKIERNVVDKGNSFEKLMVKNNIKDVVEKVPFQPQMKMFNAIFGGSICTEYEICKVKYKDFELKIGIGIATTQNKNFQFIYLNGRPFYNEVFSRNINNAFQRHYELWGDDIRTDEHGKVISTKSNMFGRPYSVNPIFLAMISAPIEVSELIQDPSKACFSSKNEKMFTYLFSKAIDIFFGLFSKRKREEIGSPTRSVKPVKISKSTRGSVILKSNVRMSDMVTHELNGRLYTNKTTGKYHNRTFDLQKIQKGLQNTNNNVTDKGTNLNKDEEFNNCNSCEDVQIPCSQSEATKKSSFFNNYCYNEITKNDIKSFKLIGQVDSKFILVKFENRIIGLDQHASDERINLEKMYGRIVNDAMLQNYYKLDKPISLVFENEEEIELLYQYQYTLRIWGIFFTIQNPRLILVTHLMVMVAQRISKDSDILKKGILEYLYNIEKGTKQITDLGTLEKISKQGNLNVNQIMQTHCPAIIVETAKSRACRSAIMFGDHLSTEEQQRLLDQLAYCWDPFRCAHGRPSLYPLCVLSDAEGMHT